MIPVVIAVAITGSVPRKRDNPAVPILPSEQIESTHEACEAGASLVHIHVRNDDESSSSDPERFALVQEGVRKHCPGMIVQFSTGGRGRDKVPLVKTAKYQNHRGQRRPSRPTERGSGFSGTRCASRNHLMPSACRVADPSGAWARAGLW